MREELYWERKTVGDFKYTADIQSKELTCHQSWRELLTMLYYLQYSLSFHKTIKQFYYKDWFIIEKWYNSSWTDQPIQMSYMPTTHWLAKV